MALEKNYLFKGKIVERLVLRGLLTDIYKVKYCYTWFTDKGTRFL